MKYEEMLEKLWQDRKTKHYEIENVKNNLGYELGYGFIGRVCFENSAVYLVSKWECSNDEDDCQLQIPLPLFLLKSDKWNIKNPRPLEPDDLFFESDDIYSKMERMSKIFLKNKKGA